MSKKLIKIACFGNNFFVNIMQELKDHFKFDLKIIENIYDYSNTDYEMLFVDNSSIVSNYLKQTKDTSITVVIFGENNEKKKNFNNYTISLPTTIKEINNAFLEINSKNNFNQNSSIKIKNYILDKNEKKIKKEDGKFIEITEKEAQFIELLLKSSKPVSKANILNIVWNYSSDVDTHTIETHVYRLRKKIFEKFNDDSFIKNNKLGYFL